MTTTLTCVYEFRSKEDADRFTNFINAAMKNTQAKVGSSTIACAEGDLITEAAAFRYYIEQVAKADPVHILQTHKEFEDAKLQELRSDAGEANP